MQVYRYVCMYVYVCMSVLCSSSSSSNSKTLFILGIKNEAKSLFAAEQSCIKRIYMHTNLTIAIQMK